ncbi:MAG TPA: DegV family protein [Anaerolineales bacterium]|jgi:DegV family protein with EDD domain
MSRVAVVTDSCASIPENLVDQMSIQTVAYYIHRGQEVLRDLVTIQRDDFLRWLPSATILPTTASPGPGDYFQKYQQLIKGGINEILSIHMTSRGSGAYQAACVAKSMIAEQYPKIRVEVVDTQNVSLCQGWMVIEAARAALNGASLDSLLALIKQMIPVTQMIQTADTLKYLYLGGRIGLAKRLMGTVLNIKPLIGMKDGVIVALGMAHSRLQAYHQMAEYVREAVGPDLLKVAYVHAGAPEQAQKLKEIVEAELKVAESMFAELSPALAVHTGPGTVGLCFYLLGK